MHVLRRTLVFERIRCAVCGDQAVSDLSYIHDETDETRRLHVCAGCHAAFPTIFAGEELNFCADVEQIVMTGLELFYQNAVEGKGSLRINISATRRRWHETHGR